MRVSSVRHQLSKQYTKLARDASAGLAAARQVAGTSSSTRDAPREEQGTHFSPSASSSDGAASAAGHRQRHSRHPAPGMARHTSSLSPLYDPTFMGSSSRFRMHRQPSGRSAVTRSVLTGLESERLTHTSPSTINDHLCIRMVKALRWVADRVFRERHIHRATMLKTLAAAPATAAAVTTFVRLTGRSARQSTTPSSTVLPRASVYGDLGEALSGSPSRLPHLGSEQPMRTSSSAADAAGASTNDPPRQDFMLGDRLAGLDTLRGLLAQAECHTAHHQILTRMAEITPLERFFVLFAQTCQFITYGFIFLFYPRMGFRLIGYTLEESSVVWTQMINDIDLGKISERRVPALALQFWGLEGEFVPQGAPPPVVVVADANSSPTTRSPFGMASPITSSAGSTSPPTPRAAHASPSASPTSTTTVASTQSTFDADVTQSTTQSDDDDDSHMTDMYARSDEITLTLRDVVLLIRSDEMYYRDASHQMADAIDRISRERSSLSWSQRFMDSAEVWLKK